MKLKVTYPSYKQLDSGEYKVVMRTGTLYVHKFTQIELNGKRCDIDEALVQLILLMNIPGKLETLYCCQGFPRFESKMSGCLYVIFRGELAGRIKTTFRQLGLSIEATSKAAPIPGWEVRSEELKSAEQRDLLIYEMILAVFKVKNARG
jgi:hypothetical protein